MQTRNVVFLLVMGLISSRGWAKEADAGKASVVRTGTSAKLEKRAEPGVKDYTNYLPFGAGQFHQNKNWLGFGLAAAQAGSMMFYFSTLSKLDSQRNDVHMVMRDSKSNDPSLVDYLNQSEAFEKQTQKQAQMALLGFFGLYAFGVIDAIYDPLNTSSMNVTLGRSVASQAKDKPSAQKAKELAKRETKVKSKSKVAPVVAPQQGKPIFGFSVARDF